MRTENIEGRAITLKHSSARLDRAGSIEQAGRVDAGFVVHNERAFQLEDGEVSKIALQPVGIILNFTEKFGREKARPNVVAN